MSLEDNIAALIKALDRNTNTLLEKRNASEPATSIADLASKVETGVPKAAAAAKKPVAKPVEMVGSFPKVPAPPTTTEVKAQAKAEKASGYDEVAKATLKLHAEKGKAVVIEILSRFGVTTAKNLTPDKYPDYMQALAESSEDGVV